MSSSKGNGTSIRGGRASASSAHVGARAVIPAAPALPRKPLNPNAKPFHPARIRASRAYMYTPFGGADALKAAVGENMARISNSKAPHPLLAPSHKAADRMEALRSQTVQAYGKIVNHSKNVVATHQARGRQRDAALLASIRHETDNSSGDADMDMMTKGMHLQNHRFNLSADQTNKIIAEANLASYGPRHEALSQTRIVNTSANLYPQLYSDPPLQHVRRDQKLYVLGHGAANFDGIASTQDGRQTMSSQTLIHHLQEKGLSHDFEDLRLTACQGIPEQVNYNAHSARNTAAHSDFVAPRVFRAAQKSGFKRMKVTGYAGDGVTFPFGSERHLRSMSDQSRARRSTKSLQFKPTHKA